MSLANASADQAPPSWAPRGIGAMPLWVLRPVRAVAIIVVISMLLGRSIAPSLQGLTVGIDTLVDVMNFASGAVAQLCAIVLTMLGMAMVVVVAQARPVPIPVRIIAIGTGGAIILIALSATGIRLPDTMLALLTLTVALLCVVVSLDALRHPLARWVGLLFGVAGVAGVLRLASFVMFNYAEATNASGASDTAHHLATAAFATECMLVFGGLWWVVRTNVRRVGPLALAALAIALIITAIAMTTSPESGVLSTLIARCAHHLLSRPEPSVPLAVDVFVAVFALASAGVVLAARTAVPPVAGALAMALIVRGGLEVPIFSVVMLVGALSVVLGIRDPRGVWAAVPPLAASAGQEPVRPAPEAADGGPIGAQSAPVRPGSDPATNG